jgi:hypothetical protein
MNELVKRMKSRGLIGEPWTVPTCRERDQGVKQLELAVHEHFGQLLDPVHGAPRSVVQDLSEMFFRLITGKPFLAYLAGYVHA